jgi:hypothetical protein
MPDSKSGPPPEEGSSSSAAEDRRRFEEDLAARGEAAPADEDGDLPPGATHEIEEKGDGERTVRRRRFSAN